MLLTFEGPSCKPGPWLMTENVALQTVPLLRLVQSTYTVYANNTVYAEHLFSFLKTECWHLLKSECRYN